MTGIHKHMRMLQVQKRIEADSGRRVPIRAIWAHLSELYDLKGIEELVRRDAISCTWKTLR